MQSKNYNAAIKTQDKEYKLGKREPVDCIGVVATTSWLLMAVGET